jgi:hypothetical protein
MSDAEPQTAGGKVLGCTTTPGNEPIRLHRVGAGGTSQPSTTVPARHGGEDPG